MIDLIPEKAELAAQAQPAAQALAPIGATAPTQRRLVRRGRRRRPRNSRGAALVVVLLAVAIMTTVVVDFVYNTRVELHMAANIRDEVRAYHLAKGGMDLARLALNLQTQIDNLSKSFGMNANIQLWQFVNQFMGAFNAGRIDLPMASVDLGSISGLGGLKGAFDVEIVPEDGKININALATPGAQRDATIARLSHLMAPAATNSMFSIGSSGGGDYQEISDIVSALIDWVDADKDLTTMGADGTYAPTGPGQEDNRYSDFGSNIMPRNAPMDSIQEVMLVKGINDDWLEAFGDSLTVYPSPAININTANRQLLGVLVCSHLMNPMDPLCDPFNPLRLMDLLTAIEMERRFRQMLFMTPFASKDAFMQFMRNGQGSIPFFLFEPVPTESIDWQKLAQNISVKSPNIFSLHAEGRIGNTIKRIHAVVDITSQGKMLYWREY